jgi:hypothetical protein
MKASNAWSGGGSSISSQGGKPRPRANSSSAPGHVDGGATLTAMCLRLSSRCGAGSGVESLVVDRRQRAAAPNVWERAIAGIGVSRAQRGVIGINYCDPGYVGVLARRGKRLVPAAVGVIAATPKFEVKRHGASGHSNDCMPVPPGSYSASNFAGAAQSIKGVGWVTAAWVLEAVRKLTSNKSTF